MKALIMLVGMDPIPNVLTIIHEQPDIIFAITYSELRYKIEKWKMSLKEIFEEKDYKYAFEEILIDRYDTEQIKVKCVDLVGMHPEATWIFNITSGTTTMCMGAYEAAQAIVNKNINCCFLDISRAKVFSFVGDEYKSNIFNIKVHEYIKAHFLSVQEGASKNNKELYLVSKTWLNFAEKLGKDIRLTNTLKQIMQELPGSPSKGDNMQISELYCLKKSTPYRTLEFLQGVQEAGLITNLHMNAMSHICFSLSEPQYKFLDGVWLELYVLQEIRKLGIFDDSKWNQEFTNCISDTNLETTFICREIDVAATYKSHLVVIECKTGKKAFKQKTLSNIMEIAKALGVTHIKKVLVTSFAPSRADRNQKNAFLEFKSQAENLSVNLVTQEDLPNVGEILRQVATTDI